MEDANRARSCRFCGSPLGYTFVDLGMSPLANSYVPVARRDRMEAFYPLHAFVCAHCLLVQLDTFESPEHIFTQYAYFSSYSESWLRHAQSYVEAITRRLGLDGGSQVVEVASNDGYLLQYFIQKGVPALGIEPAANVAAVAIERGVPTRIQFFGRQAAQALVADGTRADLLVANNVLAHVPDLNDFVGGLAVLLAPTGVATLEFPHLMRLMAENQFDTIYHEHLSYFSFLAVERIFAHHGLRIFDVDELPTHGGSLRIYARHEREGAEPVTARVAELRGREESAGFGRLDHYLSFGGQVAETKRALLAFMIEAKRAGKSIAAYGAPAKGNTLLNYCGIRTDFVEYTVDRSSHKQGRLLPGTRIPIYAPDRIAETRPDYLLILPWNLREEILGQMAHIRDWGGQFVVPIPTVTVC
jgi:SAM-dependent methyltransferase